MRLHLDTDFAGDTDDAAALAMLFGWPGAEVVGVTTTADPGGWRAGYVHRLLELAGREDIPVASGASTSLDGRAMGDLPVHGSYWGDDPVTPRPSPRGAAVDLLISSADSSAVLVAIGPYTNLAEIEEARPGVLATCSVTLMGGWVDPPAADLPQWGPGMDWKSNATPLRRCGSSKRYTTPSWSPCRPLCGPISAGPSWRDSRHPGRLVGCWPDKRGLTTPTIG